MIIPYPPRFNGEIEPFGDALEIIIPKKIEKMLKYIQVLEDQRDQDFEDLNRLKKKKNLDEATIYFWSFWAELKFASYHICRKWLFYWLSLYEKLPDKPKLKFDKLKDEISLQRKKETPIEIFYQGNLRVNGSRLLGLCPFHEEKTPSFFIFTNTNRYNCFGCGKNGDVINFIEKTRKIDFKEALKLL